MGEMIEFRRPDGGTAPAYCVEPEAGGKAPGIVVIQEWWGLNDQIKGVARKLAEAGYRTLVPDLYRGTVTLEAAEAAHLMGSLDFGDAATQDIRGAVAHLKQQSDKVGVIGFCMGGALSVLAAVCAPQADAVVSWYGVPPAEAADVSTVAMPLQGHFARQDAFFPAQQVEGFEARLKEGKVDYELYWYDANHAFGNEQGAYYDPDAAKTAWERSMTFFNRHLRG